MPELRPTALQARLAVFAGAIVVAGASWVALYGYGVWSPVPSSTIAPAAIIGESLLGNVDAGVSLVPLIGAAFFLLLAIPLVSPRSKVVLPSVIFCGLLTLGSVIHFLGGWSYGVRYQGIIFTVKLSFINLGLAALAVWLGWKAYRLRTYAYRFAFTLLISLWFVWFAFPWLGEMP